MAHIQPSAHPRARAEAAPLRLSMARIKAGQVLIDVALTRMQLRMAEGVAVISRILEVEPMAVETLWRCLRRDNADKFAAHEAANEEVSRSWWRDWESLMAELQGVYRAYRAHIDDVLAAAEPHDGDEGAFRVYATPKDAVRTEHLVKHVPRTLEEAKDYEEAPLVLCDNTSTIRFVNDAWSHLTGYVPEECVGRRISALIAGDKTDRTTAALLTKAAVTCDIGCAAGTLTNYCKDGVTPFTSRVYVSRLHSCGNLYVGLSVPLVPAT